MTEFSRRNLLRNGTVLAATGSIPAAAAIPAQPRPNFLTPTDFGADATGSTDAHRALQRAVEASARENLPLVLNGIYRLGEPLKIFSNVRLTGTGSLRAAHSGSLLTSGEKTVARVSIDGIQLEAMAGAVERAVDGVQWQYARLHNLRIMSAGGVFKTGFYFTNVAYWNSVTSIEAEAVQTLFDLGDSNNLILNDINWCRFSDIGMRSFIHFHAGCSAVYGRGLSAEGVFQNAVLVQLLAECENIDLEFIRIEGREGSRNTTLIDFRGSHGNCVRLPPTVLGLFGEAVRNERGNFLLNMNSNGFGASHLGRGEVVAPLADHDPTLEGALNYNQRMGRLRANVAGPRSLTLNPALDPLDMNGHDIRNVASLTLCDNGDTKGATLSADRKSRTLQVDFGDGKNHLFAQRGPTPVVKGSHHDGEALTSLLHALDAMGLIVDRTVS